MSHELQEAEVSVAVLFKVSSTLYCLAFATLPPVDWVAQHRVDGGREQHALAGGLQRRLERVVHAKAPGARGFE